MPETAHAKVSDALKPKDRAELLQALEARFRKNMHRHQTVAWHEVQARLETASEKLRSLFEMERSGGEPDIIGAREKSGEFIFVDCAAESPAGRRSVCYDRKALESRKEHKPKSSAMDLAAEMGVQMLTEHEYFDLQKVGEFDLKSSSWIATPPAIRNLGGALYCERRYGRIFIGHNGAQSYYAVRGFRASLRV